MPKFRKKPVVIEAFQLTEETRRDNRDWPAWLNEACDKLRTEPGAFYCNPRTDDGGDRLEILTLEGRHKVSIGDYIIKGVKGELYPCKPDIFKATYVPVDADGDVADWCEGCVSVATGVDNEGVHLCAACLSELSKG